MIAAPLSACPLNELENTLEITILSIVNMNFTLGVA
jgi:hypothetical protein